MDNRNWKLQKELKNNGNGSLEMEAKKMEERTGALKVITSFLQFTSRTSL